jgi:hypothetical protein
VVQVVAVQIQLHQTVRLEHQAKVVLVVILQIAVHPAVLVKRVAVEVQAQLVVMEALLLEAPAVTVAQVQHQALLALA